MDFQNAILVLKCLGITTAEFEFKLGFTPVVLRFTFPKYRF